MLQSAEHALGHYVVGGAHLTADGTSATEAAPCLTATA